EAPNPSPRALLRGTLEDRGADPSRVAQLPRLPDLSFEDRPAIQDGLHWLLDLQNRDGGFPTFCRGWGKLPFDRSGSDLTAHALRSLEWEHREQKTAPERGFWTLSLGDTRLLDERSFGLLYLDDHQRPDGSWLPLWFGNQ